MKDYTDDDGPDEKKFSDAELGASVLDSEDGLVYEDENSVHAGLSDEEIAEADSDEEEYVYDEHENDYID